MKSLAEPIMTLFQDVYIYGLMQERLNSIANALELRLSCTNPSIYASLNVPKDLPTSVYLPLDNQCY